MLIKVIISVTIIIVIGFVRGNYDLNSNVYVNLNSPIVNQEKILQKTNFVNDDNDSLELVVKTYCEYAKHGKFNELKNLITSKSNIDSNKTDKQRKQSNEEEVDDSQLQNEINHLLLEKLIPDTIYSGKLYVGQTKTISAKNQVGKVYVELNSPIDSAFQTALIFYLFQDKKEKWAIYNVEYTKIETIGTNKNI